MIPELARLLEFLCAHCDQARLARSRERFIVSLNWQAVDRPPVVVSAPLPASFPFRPFPFHEIFQSPEKMLYNELLHAFDLSIAAAHDVDTDLPWTVRANYGTVLLASMYGAAVEQVGDNPPWVQHNAGAEISLEHILAIDPHDMTVGWMPRVRETMECYRDLLAGFPPLDEAISITLPDLQGPFDNFEQIRGTNAFIDLLDSPELANEAMRRIAETQVAAARYLQPYCTDGPPGYCHQHGFMLRGNILLRCDSAIMVSPEIYSDLIAPHDDWVMQQLGGGGIHCCGRMMHLVEGFLRLPALQSLDLGQSELNDRDQLYALARTRKTALIRLHVTPDELAGGTFEKRFPTGIAAICRKS
jgi:hypothetical protein